MPIVLYSVESNVSSVILNRPEKLNAINDELMDELKTALRKADEDPLSKVIVLRGAGRAFSSGFDISQPLPANADSEYFRDMTIRELEMLRSILELKKPIICGVHGYAVGMGFGLMTACDIIIATDDAKIGTPEVRYGYSGTEWILPITLGRNRAMEFFLTGDTVSGKEAAELGIVNRSVSADAFDRELTKIARKLSFIPNIALRMNKAAINEFYHVNDLKQYFDYLYDNCSIIFASNDFKTQHEMKSRMPLKEYFEKMNRPFRELEK